MGKDDQREELPIISSPSQKMDHNHVVALDVEVPQTLHAVGTDSWFQVGVVLSTGVNSAYALGYAGTIMVPLGWTGGVIGFVLSTLISVYASTLMAKIHEYGGKRHIRYRDLAGFMYGRAAYVIVWASQYANLFLINIGFIILGGQALKAVYRLFEEDDRMKLAYFIAIAGLACILFAIAVPTLSSLRIWLAISSLFSLIYLTIAFVLALRDGINAPPRDYSIPGSKINRFFMTVGAAANLVFVFNTGMIPEIQIFASPTYEYLDTKYEIKGSAIAIRNLALRGLVRGGYLALTTFLSALLPFLGDFMSLTGAISSIPLTFILPNHMYIIAMTKKLSSLQKSWHLLNVIFFSVVAAAALVASFRLIAVDSKTYHTFADL